MKKKNDQITRKEALKKFSKYTALTAIGTFAILNPQMAQAVSNPDNPNTGPVRDPNNGGPGLFDSSSPGGVGGGSSSRGGSYSKRGNNSIWSSGGGSSNRSRDDYKQRNRFKEEEKHKEKDNDFSVWSWRKK